MARFYSNENFPLQCVEDLRRLGHDVLTSFDAGNANRAVPDEVLSYSAQDSRILLTQNRRHFVTLHIRNIVEHAGIIICTKPNGIQYTYVQAGVGSFSPLHDESSKKHSR